MVEPHNYKQFPELTNTQLQEMPFDSPHQQITEDFHATVTRVHDGDTITVETDFRDFGFPIRMLGIDASELNAGGSGVGDWLRDRIEGESVEVLVDRNERVGKYGRLLGRIIHRGLNLGDEMLRLGMVTTFENRREGQLEPLDKIFAVKQWV